jgi:RNA polymerase sigma-70 factor, ECF subfamily
MNASSDVPETWNYLRAGDRQAFECFYREHAARLQNYLRRCLPDPKVAEEIAQDAFVQLWRRPNGFNPGRGSPAAYLFGIAAKRAADWWRHHPSQSPAQPEAPVRQGDLPVLMANALARMDPEKRSLLWLREIEGYSYQELAEVLELPLGTVRSRLFAAREQLRRIWKGEGITEGL